MDGGAVYGGGDTPSARCVDACREARCAPAAYFGVSGAGADPASALVPSAQSCAWRCAPYDAAGPCFAVDGAYPGKCVACIAADEA